MYSQTLISAEKILKKSKINLLKIYISLELYKQLGKEMTRARQALWPDFQATGRQEV
jgi:hypothetical protein